MQIHEIQPKTKIKKKKRIGRGGKRGTFSGKGVKGQKARAGAKMPPMVRELIKRYPKLRGYRFSPLKKSAAVNISVLDKVFEDGEVVNPKSITKKGLTKKGENISVKILGKGDTEKKFFIEGCNVSKSAKETIEKAGGKVREKKSKFNTKNPKKIQNSNSQNSKI